MVLECVENRVKRKNFDSRKQGTYRTVNSNAGNRDKIFDAGIPSRGRNLESGPRYVYSRRNLDFVPTLGEKIP